jgi:trans-aconitate methyltransferase
MPIGTAGAVFNAGAGRSSSRRAWRHAYGRIYGCSDLHTHIRWRAIRRVVDPHGSMVDVGCGDGMLTLELARRFTSTSVRGIDVDPGAIAQADRTRTGIGVHNASFECADVGQIHFDTVGSALLLDILEHVDDDESLVDRLGSAVPPGGRVVVSTPTPNFPRFFGREFHEAVGHVRDGYEPGDVADLLKHAGFVVDSSTYYTRLPSSLVCSLYYRYLWRGKLGVLASPFLNALSYLDLVWPWDRGASSILVVATKRAA